MAFDTTPPRFDYVGTGAVATYDFPNLKIAAGTDLRVTKQDTAGVETTLVFGVGFTVTGLNLTTGGSITLTAGNLPLNYKLTIRYDRTPDQTTDYRNQGGVFLEVVEDSLDRLTRYVQAVRDKVQRSMHLPETEVGTELATLTPTLALRANKFAYWDGAGNLTGVVVVMPGALTVSAFIETLLDDANAATARETLQAFAIAGGILTGDLLFTDATLDIGKSGATRPRDLFLSRNCVVGGTVNVTGIATLLALLDLSGAAAGQIKFPAAQNPSANANTLDDYEEGTWTPSLGGTATYFLQSGAYVKIGNTVFVQGRLTVNAIGTGSTSVISGLPFTAAAQVAGSCDFSNLALSVTTVVPRVVASGTTITFVSLTAAGNSLAVNAIFGANSAVTFSMFYTI